MNTQVHSTTNQADPFTKLWSRLLIGFGILFTTVGLGMLINQVRFETDALYTTGSVVALNTVESTDGPNFVPVIGFKTDHMQNITFEGVSTSPSLEVGQSVNVVYHADDAKHARVNSFVGRWLFPAIFILVGCLSLMAGFVGLQTANQKLKVSAQALNNISS